MRKKEEKNMTNEQKIIRYKNDPSVCRILNPKQAGLYCKHNVFPKDVYFCDGSLICVFDRYETTDLYFKWCKRELD